MSYLDIVNWETAFMPKKFSAQLDEIAGISQRTGWSLEELASRVAITTETMRKISRGYQKASPQLMQALRLIEQTAAAERMGRLAQGGPRMVPVVSWARAGLAHDFGDLCNQLEESVESSCRDPNAFALILEGDSMEPDFLAGDIVVFAPNSEARSGDFVVCRLEETHGVLFKRLRRTGSSAEIYRLESLNPAYRPVEYPAQALRFVYPAVDMHRRLRHG